MRDDLGNVLLDRSSTRIALDDSWRHIVWTETNGEARLYIDGVLDETVFNYARGPVSPNTTTLGGFMSASGAQRFFQWRS